MKFEYEREGWEYSFENSRIFVENIRGWKPSIEIESLNEKELQVLCGALGVYELVGLSVPEIMGEIFHNLK